MASAKPGSEKGEVTATLALGSNIGDKARNIDKAVAMLGEGDGVRVVARSHTYRTAPWGVTDQNWFANACVLVRTSLDVHALLKKCHSVENEMGRVRERHWGPRIIDVDILTYGDETVSDADLVVPHPRIAERAFVLVPLIDVAPDMQIGGMPLRAMLSKLDASDVKVLAPLPDHK